MIYERAKRDEIEASPLWLSQLLNRKPLKFPA